MQNFLVVDSANLEVGLRMGAHGAHLRANPVRHSRTGILSIIKARVE